MFPQPGTGIGAGFGGNAPSSAGGGGGQREVRYKVTVTADVSPAQAYFESLTQSANRTVSATQKASEELRKMQSMGRNWGGTDWGKPTGMPTPMNPAGQPNSLTGGPASNMGGSAALGSAISGLMTQIGIVTAGFMTLARGMSAIGDLGSNTISARGKTMGIASSIPIVGPHVIAPIVGSVVNWHERYSQRYGGYLQRPAESGELAQRKAGAREAVLNSYGKPTALSRLLLGNPLVGAISDLATEMNLGDELYNKDRDFVNTAGPRMERMRMSAQYDADRRAMALVRGNDIDRATAFARTQQAMGRLEFTPGVGMPGRFDANDNYDAMIRGSVRGRESARISAGLAGSLDARNTAELMAARRSSQNQDRILGATGGNAIAELAEARRIVGYEMKPLKVSVAETEQITRYQQELVRLQEALNQSKQTTIQRIQAEYDLANKTLDVQRSQLQVVEAKKAKLTGYAETYGTMDVSDRNALLRAAETAKTSGLGSLTQEEKSALLGSSITGDYFRKRAGEGVLNNPDSTFQKLLVTIDQEDKKTLDNLTKKFQGEIQVQLTINTDRFVADMKKAIDQLNGENGTVKAELLRLDQLLSKIREGQGFVARQ